MVSFYKDTSQIGLEPSLVTLFHLSDLFKDSSDSDNGAERAGSAHAAMAAPAPQVEAVSSWGLLSLSW